MKTQTITSDIYFAASLLTLGCLIESVDRADPKHIKFTVSLPSKIYKFASENIPDVTTTEEAGIELYENLWLNGKLQVNAVAFKHSFQYMQSILHSP